MSISVFEFRNANLQTVESTEGTGLVFFSLSIFLGIGRVHADLLQS